MAIEKGMELIYQMEDPNDPVTKSLLEAVAREIFKMYLWDRSNE